MPALLIHLTVAHDLARQKEVPSLFFNTVKEEKGALLLGSILPDLPYHARFGHQMLCHLLQRAYLSSEWGDLMHFRQTGRFALGLITHLIRTQPAPKPRQEILALLAGYLSHHALDRVVHPVINQLVAKQRKEKAPLPILHSRLERYQNLFYHLDRLGFDISGSAYAKDLITQIPGASLVHPGLSNTLWQAIRTALLETHGRTPTHKELSNWLWGVTAYGHVFSSPIGLLEKLPQENSLLRADTYQGPTVDLFSPINQALNLTLEYWRAAASALEADRLTDDVRRVFLHHVPNIDLATGA